MTDRQLTFDEIVFQGPQPTAAINNSYKPRHEKKQQPLKSRVADCFRSYAFPIGFLTGAIISTCVLVIHLILDNSY